MFASPKQVLSAAATQLDIFQTASWQGERRLSQQNHKAANTRWRTLEEPYVKADWDAALNIVTNSTGLGGIIRDSNGEAMVTVCSSLRQTTSPLLAEALALRKLMLVG